MSKRNSYLLFDPRSTEKSSLSALRETAKYSFGPAGLSLGGAFGGWLPAAYGYKANVAQTAQALMGIRMTVSIYPALLYFMVAICLCFYGIGKKLNLEIQDELAERRSHFASRKAKPPPRR